jgi:hypothetical protein
MCFRPNNRASSDHAPGPIIAKLTPKPEINIAVHRSAAPQKRSHSCVAAIRIPIYGVHSPITSRPDAINGKTIVVKCWVALACNNARFRRMAPRRNRWINSPVPGHPSANVENKRCTVQAKTFTRNGASPKRRRRSSPIQGLRKLMIPRLKPRVTACARSFAPSFESMFAT